MKDKQKFKDFMAGLGLLFNTDIVPALSAIYWETLEPFSDEDCETTSNQLIVSCKFFPKPVEFLDILKGTPVDNALEGWGIVMEWLHHDTPVTDPVIIQTVKVLGGWDRLASQTYDELVWTEKRFIEHFQVIEKRSKVKVIEPPKGTFPPEGFMRRIK